MSGFLTLREKQPAVKMMIVPNTHVHKVESINKHFKSAPNLNSTGYIHHKESCH